MRLLRPTILSALALTLIAPSLATAELRSGPQPPAVAAPAQTGAVQTGAVRAAASEVLATGLDHPWGMARLPDGSALVTERDTGRVWQIGPGRQQRVVYTVTESRSDTSEGGLLGVAVANNFSSTRKYFVYYTTATDNRVATIIFGSSARPRPIVTGIPRGNIHNGGGLHVFPGKPYLYIGTGDAGNANLAQDPASLAGKILKVDSAGRAAPDNRWGRVATIGHRNVQGLSFNSAGSVLFASELGQNTFDEVNALTPGGNFGWPVCEGVCRRSGYIDPVWTSPTSETSPSGLGWVETPQGVRFYLAALRGQKVWRMKMSGRSVEASRAALTNSFGRIRNVLGRGDGSLWIATDNGGGNDRIIRFRPPPGA